MTTEYTLHVFDETQSLGINAGRMSISIVWQRFMALPINVRPSSSR